MEPREESADVNEIGDRFQRIESRLDWLLQQRRALSAGNAQLLSNINSCDSLVAQIRSHWSSVAASPSRGAANGNGGRNLEVELADEEDDDLADDVDDGVFPEQLKQSKSKEQPPPPPPPQAQRRRPPPPPPHSQLNSQSASSSSSLMSSTHSSSTAARRTQSGGDPGGQRWRQVPVRLLSEEGDRRFSEVRLLPHRAAPNCSANSTSTTSSRMVRQAGVTTASSVASVQEDVLTRETGSVGSSSPARKPTAPVQWR